MLLTLEIMQNNRSSQTVSQVQQTMNLMKSGQLIDPENQQEPQEPPYPSRSMPKGDPQTSPPRHKSRGEKQGANKTKRNSRRGVWRGQPQP